MNMRLTWPFVMLVVAEALVYAAGNVVMELAYADMSVLWLAALRFGLAAAVLALLFTRRIVRGLRQARMGTWLPASACTAVSFVGCAVAIGMSGATNASFFATLPMLFAPAFSWLAFSRAPRPAIVVLQAGVVAGLYLLCCSDGGFSFGIGEGVALASSAFLAAGIVAGEQAMRSLDAATLSFTQVGIAFLVALAGALAFETPPVMAAIAPASWVAIAFLVLAGTCLTFFMQNAALSRVSSSTVSAILCAEPVFTAALSWAAFGEGLAQAGIVGAALVVACAAAASLLESKPMPSAQKLQARCGLNQQAFPIERFERDSA